MNDFDHSDDLNASLTFLDLCHLESSHTQTTAASSCALEESWGTMSTDLVLEAEPSTDWNASLDRFLDFSWNHHSVRSSRRTNAPSFDTSSNHSTSSSRSRSHSRSRSRLTRSRSSDSLPTTGVKSRRGGRRVRPAATPSDSKSSSKGNARVNLDQLLDQYESIVTTESNHA